MLDIVFYRLWLLAPIGIPALLALLGPVVPTPPEPWLSVWVYVALSFWLGAIPYVPLVILAWKWVAEWPPARVRLLAVVMPLPVLGFNALLVHAPWQLAVGISYGYVVLFLVTEVALRAAGRLHDHRLFRDQAT